MSSYLQTSKSLFLVPELPLAPARAPSPTIIQLKTNRKPEENGNNVLKDAQKASNEEDEMMKILKNAPSTNLMEKVKKRQVKQLSHCFYFVPCKYVNEYKLVLACVAHTPTQ